MDYKGPLGTTEIIALGFSPGMASGGVQKMLKIRNPNGNKKKSCSFEQDPL